MSSIYDSVPDEFFLKKVDEFEPLLWYAAKRFEIPGVLLPEDLYQEGLIALEETFDNHWTCDPDSYDFTRAFKSRLFHRMSEVLRRHKTESRDWRKELHATLDNDDENEVLGKIPQTTFPSPDHLLAMRDLSRYLEAIEAELKQAAIDGPLFSTIADDALELLRILVDPDFELPEHIKSCYERLPSSGLSNSILAELTGWDIMHVRRALKRLRKHAAKLASQFGLVIPSEE